MRVIQSELPEVKVVTTRAHEDDRGSFVEAYNAATLRTLGIDLDCVQINHSFSSSVGTIRGLHFQAPPQQSQKLIRVLVGSIFDVAVDIRRFSPTFGSFAARELVGGGQEMMYVPPGFAHGFCTLTPDTLVEYVTDKHWDPAVDRGVRWDDPSIGVDWPLAGEPTLSERDRAQPLLKEVEGYQWRTG